MSVAKVRIIFGIYFSLVDFFAQGTKILSGRSRG